MKKYLTILLAALLLVCAVSCSSSPKKTGIQLDTKAVEDELATATKVELVCDNEKGELNLTVLATVSLKDAKEGSVFVELKEGTYEHVYLQIDGGLPLNPVKPSKTKEMGEGGTFKVKKGEVTECKVIALMG